MSAERQFIDTFLQVPQAIGRAWGRVNLIGEHLDYNGGMVLPAPIGRFIEVAITLSEPHAKNTKDQFHSNVFEGLVARSQEFQLQGDWSDYVAASLALARQQGLLKRPVKISIYSDIPHGAGVSSSAALIVATLRAVLALDVNDQNESIVKTPHEAPDETIVAQWAQQVENQYLGVPCGIMDQIAVSVGELGQAIALDTISLQRSLVALPKTYHFSVVFSGISRKLDEGRYAVRRQECEDAAAQLGVPFLCTMTAAQSEKISQLPVPLSGRARHAYSEQQRVLKAIDFLAQDKIVEFGKLMDLSHQSMRDDFEITLPEIDRLVESCRQYGAVGARMTGGGFGGCVVACVACDDFSQWSQQIVAAYPEASIVC